MDSTKIKHTLRDKLPSSGFKFFYKLWRIYKLLIYYILLVLNTLTLWPLNIILRSYNYYLFVLDSGGFGDHLVFTPILTDFSKKHKIIVITKYPDVFEHLNLKIKTFENFFFREYLLKFLKSSIHSNIIGTYNSEHYIKSKDKNHLRLRELLLFKRVDIRSKIRGIQQEAVISFSKKELSELNKKYGELLKKNYGVIVSGIYGGGLAEVKNWGLNNFQDVVNKTSDKINWVQTGTSEDPKISKIYLDLRSKTTLRELFFLVSRAKLVVTTEGLLNHISSAFNIPCLTIYSGYFPPSVASYKNTIIIESNPVIECAYCWTAPCALYKKAKCIQSIKPERVIKEINKIVK